ncbi:Nramp family divalent metal transporter [Rohdeia mirabilis]|uniref:Nramp family divalent metal transporter n=1 Tax=Rohdeia mirabilis TaxID=2528008 RepID=UPI003AF3C43E
MSERADRSGAPDRPGPWRRIGPGLLVAATGVGAGDLATSAFTGSALGVAVLWAVVVGAVFKFTLNEGLARWQLVTGETLLEGVMRRVPRPLRFAFLVYLLPWTWIVGSALMGACGATAHALFGGFEDPATGKVVWGVVHSLAGLALVLVGGFRLFERLMGVAVGVMFVTVVATAIALAPDWAAVGNGLVVPRIPDADGAGLGWTIALMGGVGGTLTVLCYGYWIREEGRDGPSDIGACRLDLGVGYAMTAIFGIAMVVIGSTVVVEGRGAGLIVALGDRLRDDLGPVARNAFLVGAWAAVFSSLVGVWQAVPYLFADFWRLAVERRPAPVVGSLTRTRSYRFYLFALAFAPMAGLAIDFRSVQQIYAIVGAAFMPLLAVALLLLNGRFGPLGAHRDRVLATVVLLGTLAFFAYQGVNALAP